jgi:tRNA(fMet)-specific endonuclease VapC
MSGRYLLDTNIIIAIFAEEPAVLQRVAVAEEVFVPVMSQAPGSSLDYGLKRSGDGFAPSTCRRPGSAL